MKKLAFFMLVILSLSMSATGLAATTDSTSPFPDVDATHPYEEGIKYLKANGIIGGYPDGNYKPSSEINRAEFTKIIIGALTSEPKGSNCFPDVKEDWYAKFVCEAKTRGIISGYPDGNFKPTEKIKFSEAAKIIANAFGASTATNVSTSTPNWYKPFVEGLEAKSDIPLSVEFFDENVTRDEMAEMIYRLKAKKTDEPSRTYEEINGEDFVTVKSCTDLEKRYQEMQVLNNYNSYYRANDVVMMDGEEGMAMPADATTAPAPSKAAMSELGGGGSSDYSTTNIQVEGVDEADVVKNDGKYIYLIKSNTVRVIEAYPASNMKELVSFSLGEENETFYPTDMYVDADQMTVIGNVSRTYEPVIVDSADTEQTAEKMTTDMIYPPYPYYVNRSKVFVIDMADRSHPKVTRSVEFDGNYTSSRKVGDTLYMILNQYPYYYPLYSNNGPGVDGGGTMTSEPHPESFAPHLLDSAEGNDRLTVPCSDIMILPKSQNFNFLIAAAVPLKDTDKKVTSEVLAGDSGTIYASKTGLYVAATDWTGGFYKPYSSDYGTAVYHFALGNGTIEYKNKGRVPGTILNQFSMDEYNDAFRIATTKNEYVEGSKISNNLFVLDTDDMTIEGKVENIAPGETIYSTRFVGDRAYMVTFKRVDPLFVIDLKDPKNPKIEGKLKIPGYSTYLEPYDENHLIGFGNEVDENADNPEMVGDDFIYYTAVQGLKISLFDVTDLSNPKEMYKEVIGDRGTSSDVLYNHKALLFDKEKNLMSFPVQVMEIPDTQSCSDETYSSCPTSCTKICVPSSCTYEGGIKVCTTDCDGENSCVQNSYEYGKPTFSGAYVYNITLDKGFQLKGKVSHYTDEEAEAAKTTGYYADYQKMIQRILYIGDTLYTVSQGAVKANSLSDLTEKKMIELVGDAWEIYYGKPMPL